MQDHKGLLGPLVEVLRASHDNDDADDDDGAYKKPRRLVAKSPPFPP